MSDVPPNEPIAPCTCEGGSTAGYYDKTIKEWRCETCNGLDPLPDGGACPKCGGALGSEEAIAHSCGYRSSKTIIKTVG